MLYRISVSVVSPSKICSCPIMCRHYHKGWECSQQLLFLPYSLSQKVLLFLTAESFYLHFTPSCSYAKLLVSTKSHLSIWVCQTARCVRDIIALMESSGISVISQIFACGASMHTCANKMFWLFLYWMPQRLDFVNISVLLWYRIWQLNSNLLSLWAKPYWYFLKMIGDNKLNNSEYDCSTVTSFLVVQLVM